MSLFENLKIFKLNLIWVNIGLRVPYLIVLMILLSLKYYHKLVTYFVYVGMLRIIWGEFL